MRRLVCNPTIQYIIINLHTKYDNSSLHSFTEIFDEKFIIQSMERKKIGQIQGRISMRRVARNLTIQYIIVNLHTKYDYSSFDEKLHYSKAIKKENLTNTGKNKHEKAGSQFHDTIHHYKSRKGNPQKLTQLSSRSHQKHLVGKKTAQKDTIIDTASDSLVNSNFPYMWSPANI